MFSPVSRLPAGQRIIILVSVVVTGVALSSIVHLPSWNQELSVLGSPLSLGLSGRWLLALVLVGLTAAGTTDVVLAESGRTHLGWRYLATFWILPCLVTLAATVSVPNQAGHAANWLGSVVLLTALLVAVVTAEYGTVREGAPYFRLARVGLNVATYGAAFALYAAIYGLHVRSLLSATAILCVTFPLALELLRGTEEQLETTWLHAGIIAVVMAELTWALNRWGLSGLAGGGLMLIAFYTLSGVTQQHLAGRLNRRVVVEFAAIGLAGAAIIWGSSPWLAGR